MVRTGAVWPGALRPGALWPGALTATVMAIGLLWSVLYLRWTPLVPDLAAQTARADMIRTGGLTSWWTGWFGGLSMPDYSVLVPQSMAVLGVRATGLAAWLVGIGATSRLTAQTVRPRAGAVAFAVLAGANLLDGRTTFAAGFAVAAWALVAVRAHRLAAAVLLAAGAYFCSPLAGLFLGMILVAVAATTTALRRDSTVCASVLLGCGVGMAVFFPGTGTMPFHVLDAIPCVLAGIAILVVCPNRTVRAGALIMLLSVPLFLIVPSAVGANITRLSWLCAAPVIVACAQIPRRFVVVLAIALAWWPATDLTGQLTSGYAPSAQPAYYGPLAAELSKAARDAGASAIGERVEVVDTANHWGSAYLSAFALARGWDRQADHANNPIFYQDGLLDATSYQVWLQQLAVGWVALPAAALDYASVAEGHLISTGLPYLKQIWSSATWRLYRVLDAAPLAVGGRVVSVDAGGITVVTTARATVRTRLRWSPYLTVVQPVSGAYLPACILNTAGWVDVYVPRATRFQLTSRFTPGEVLTEQDPDCIADISV